MKVEIYTDTLARELTGHVTGVTWTASTRAPYLNASVTLAAPFALLDEIAPAGEGALNLNAWLVVRELVAGAERAVFAGPVTSYNYTLSADSGAGLEGLRRLDALTISASSPLHAMTEAQIALSARAVDAPPGHIYTLSTWAPIMRELITTPFSGPYLGAALARLFERLATPYRLPLTLARGASLAGLPVAYDTATTSTHAPARVLDARGLTGAAIAAVSAAAAPGGSPWTLISSIFDPDPTIAELFVSLEPVEGGAGTIGDALGALPVLIHRFRPFTVGALPSAAAVGATDAPVHPRARASLIDGVISLRAAQTDADRVNAAYITTPLTASRGVDSFGLIATPRLDPEDIDRAGLRLYRAQWPYFPPGKTEGSYSAHSQYIIDVTDQITRGAERYMSGDISARYLPHIRAGLWIMTHVGDHARERRFYCYIESATHSINVGVGGLITRRSSLNFTRGFFE